MAENVPMTAAGHAALKEKLRLLKTVERPRAILMLAEARSHGDLSENAEYDAARDKAGFLEAQIAAFEARLSRAQVIDTSKLTGDKVVFGATVTIEDSATEQQQTWTIVGDDESSLEEKKIGISSPIARALLGKKAGEDVEIRTPKGVKEASVLKVEFR
ncbi:MAG: transcription elongation factor GreA [Deltaproteobacteria bacterium]|nr:transcription elongation factor GreA [Deltaproteobacteria bacterium]